MWGDGVVGADVGIGGFEAADGVGTPVGLLILTVDVEAKGSLDDVDMKCPAIVLIVLSRL